VNFEDRAKEALWPILVETVHSLVMYPSHKAYTREAILPEKPEITPAELSARLKISLGEALIILYELAEEKKAIS
jgi:transcription initiation factor IIE alpha subunit